MLSTWGDPGNQKKFYEFPIPQQSPKLLPKTSQSHQNEVPRATQSRQNIESSEKVKSNEKNVHLQYL